MRNLSEKIQTREEQRFISAFNDVFSISPDKATTLLKNNSLFLGILKEKFLESGDDVFVNHEKNI